MATLTTEDKLVQRIWQHFNKGVVTYGLLNDGDHLLVGLSGGKDSMALLELLARRAKIWKPRIRVSAAHVSMSIIPYQADIDYLRTFAEQLGVAFYHEQASFDPSTDRRKSPCFLCSWNRRKALFTLAQRLGCNKLALGHHMDDILETLLMNMTFQGAFGSMPPKLTMRKFALTIVRPLCLTHEADLVKLAAIRGYHRQIKNCPYESASNRTAMKEFLKKLESLNPEARYSLWGCMSNIQSELLPPKP